MTVARNGIFYVQKQTKLQWQRIVGNQNVVDMSRTSPVEEYANSEECVGKEVKIKYT